MVRNTIQESDNPKRAQMNAELAEKIALPVDKAVSIIPKAVKKKKQRVRVGKDAIMLDILKRLMPVYLQTLINKAASSHVKDDY